MLDGSLPGGTRSNCCHSLRPPQPHCPPSCRRMSMSLVLATHAISIPSRPITQTEEKVSRIHVPAS
ncbi:hypothetical protein BC567DRAFT_215670 [Phyllosticta citribraziliensis]